MSRYGSRERSLRSAGLTTPHFLCLAETSYIFNQNNIWYLLCLHPSTAFSVTRCTHTCGSSYHFGMRPVLPAGVPQLTPFCKLLEERHLSPNLTISLALCLAWNSSSIDVYHREKNWRQLWIVTAHIPSDTCAQSVVSSHPGLPNSSDTREQLRIINLARNVRQSACTTILETHILCVQWQKEQGVKVPDKQEMRVQRRKD